MRLHQHPDFAAFVTTTAAQHDLREPFVEKDYWITEILRTIATTLPDRAIFKGGTSLSKGWDSWIVSPRTSTCSSIRSSNHR